jgi:hypothetical protein
VITPFKHSGFSPPGIRIQYRPYIPFVLDWIATNISGQSETD